MSAAEPRPGGPFDLGAPDLRRLVLRLALPTVVGLSANAAHHAANALFVGTMGVDALAAVTVALPFVILIAAIGEGIGVGAATAIGRYLGAGHRYRAGVVASTALAVAVPLGLGLTGITILARMPLLTLFGAPQDALPLAERYLLVTGCGATLILLQIVCDFVAIAEGNTRFSMWTLIGGFGLNLILDAVLILGLGLGVGGAALATILSQVVVLLVYAAYFARQRGTIRVLPRLARRWPSVLRPIAAIGFPTACTTGLTGIAFTLLYRAAGQEAGEAGIVAIGIALRVLTLGTLPVIGFAIGSQPVLSYAWGAGDPKRAAAAARFAAAAGSGFAILYGAVVVWFSEPIAAVFTADPGVRSLAARALVIAHLAFPLLGLRTVFLALLQAMGRAGQAAVLGLAPDGYLLVAALAVLPARMGFDGVLACLPVSAGGATLLAALFALRLFGATRRPESLSHLGAAPSPNLAEPIP